MENPQNPLSAETQSAIDSLAGEISISRHLDAELQAELRGHIEDKVSAYRTGDLRPSEQDALLLARVHFGDPTTLTALLARVHGIPAANTLFRQLATLALVTLVVKHFVSTIVQLTGVRLFVYPQIARAIENHTPLCDLTLRAVGAADWILQVLVLIVALYLIRRREAKTGRPWVRFPMLAMLALPLAIIFYASGQVLPMWYLPGVSASFSVTAGNPFVSVLLDPFILSFAMPGLMFLVWLWWLGPQRRHAHVFFATAAAWLAAMFLASIPPALFDVVSRNASPMHAASLGLVHVQQSTSRILNHHLPLLVAVGGLYFLARYLQKWIHHRRSAAGA